MKRNRIIIASIILVLFVISLGGIYCYPRSMKNILSTKSKLIIVYTKESCDSQVNLDSIVYEIPNKSNAYLQIADVFSHYKYHRYIKTLIPVNGMKFEHRTLTCCFHIFPDDADHSNRIVFGGDGRIMVKNRLYKMDFTGNQNQTEFMEELFSILDKNRDLLQKKEVAMIEEN